jgi:hypothetical protein
MTTRKKLESEGIAKIESNDFYGYGDAKWVLVLNDKYIDDEYVFRKTKTITYPAMTIAECASIYLGGIEKN